MRIQQLEKEIRQHNVNYYNNSTPSVTDSVYDGLKAELKALSPNNPLLDSVGEACYKTSIWDKIKHSSLIGSLDKVTSVGEITDWIRVKAISSHILLMHKYDGLSIVCTYKDGQLIQALTRGDGHIGEDVTENVLKIPSHRCKDGNFSGTVRGEIVVTKQNFDQHFKSNYANARNIASGTLKRSNSTDCQYLDIFFYEVKECSTMGILTRSGWLDYINHIFTNKVWHSLIASSDNDSLEQIVKVETNKRPNLPYNIDGLVVIADDAPDENKRRPNYARAYKFEAMQAQTYIKDIIWKNTGKAISPVAILDTVWLDGSNVSKASIHNVDWMTKKGIGIGAKVIISKRGDIIPQIEEVIATGQLTSCPKVCPTCGRPTKMNNQFLVCSYMNCPARNRRFVQKLFRVLDINFAGEKTIDAIAQAFTNDALMHIINDDTKLDGFETWLANLPRMGQKSAHKIIVEIKNKRSIDVMQAIWILDIDNFSSSRIKKVIEAGYDSVDKIVNITPYELACIKGFASMSSDIVWALYDAKPMLDSIVRNFLISTPPKPITKACVVNVNVLHFVLTGKLSKPRTEWGQEIASHGHVMDKAITKHTDYLVAGDGPWGSKHKKAEKLGVKVINENELENLL